MKKSYLLIGFVILIAGAAKTQSVGIGTTSPNSSALLELKSYTKGLLLPTMTAAGRNAISNPAKGLMVYDTTYNTHYYYNGSAWRPIGSSRYNTDSSLNIGNQINPVQSYNISSYNYTTDTTGFLYDNGGPGGNYTDNRNDVFYINPTGESGIVIEIFQMNTESPYDSLTIDVNNQHYVYWGNATDTLVLDNMNQSILIRFKSNSFNTAAGFGLKWKKIMPGSNPTSGYDNGQLSGWYFNEAKLYMRGGYNSNNSWHPDSSGSFSFAFGKNVKAKGKGAVALGIDNIASGANSIAMGTGSMASEYNSTAIGPNSTASGYTSTAIGFNTTASSSYTIATGSNTTASGLNSTAMGHNTTASGDYSTAMGRETLAKGYATTVLGMFNDSILTSNQYTVTSNTPLFIVGNGDNNTNRSNALVVRKDGKVFIDPSGKNSGSSVGHLLIFGDPSSLEGIGSKRTTGGNQYGLDFYTLGTRRMAITNGGTVQVDNNLTVQNGKGLIRNTDGTQSKKLSTTALINSTFTAGQTKMLTITWPEAFSGTPEAFVGNVTSGVGGWAELTMSVSNVTTTGADLYIFNPKSSSVSPNFNIKIIAIGPQ